MTQRNLGKPDLDKALESAVRQCDVEKVKALLKQGANPNSKVDRIEGREEKVSLLRLNWTLLLINKMDFNKRSENTQFFEIMKALLEQGADPNLWDANGNGYGENLLFDVGYYDVFFGSDAEIEWINLLLMNGADPRLLLPHFKSAAPWQHLHKNNFTSLADSIIQSPLMQIRMMLENGHSLNALPDRLKNASTQMISALIIYAAEHDRADVINTIFNTYQRDPEFKFLINQRDLIEQIRICFKGNNSLSIPDKLIRIIPSAPTMSTLFREKKSSSEEPEAPPPPYAYPKSTSSKVTGWLYSFFQNKQKATSKKPVMEEPPPYSPNPPSYEEAVAPKKPQAGIMESIKRIFRFK